MVTWVGRTGVVGVLRNGEGPTVLLRADFDALPVLEQTGLDYASTRRGTDPDGNDVPVMHACGHDMHVTCQLGALDLLVAARDRWAGTIVAVFQPAEEIGAGARAMIDDGFFDRFPKPDVCLGQHVFPFPSGSVGMISGPSMSAADGIKVTMFGRGAHGSQPQNAIDPVVMASATVMRLQTVVSREVAPSDTAVVTVGAIKAGTKDNIIPDQAELRVNIRSFDEQVRERVIAAVKRIVRVQRKPGGLDQPHGKLRGWHIGAFQRRRFPVPVQESAEPSRPLVSSTTSRASAPRRMVHADLPGTIRARGLAVSRGSPNWTGGSKHVRQLPWSAYFVTRPMSRFRTWLILPSVSATTAVAVPSAGSASESVSGAPTCCGENPMPPGGTKRRT